MVSSDGLIFNKLKIFTLLAALLIGTGVSGQATRLDSLYTFNSGSIKTGSALNIITRKTGFNFTYDSRLVNTEQKCDLNFKQVPLRNILLSILGNDSISLTTIDNYIIIARKNYNSDFPADDPANNQPMLFSGKVTDAENKEALSFASVFLLNNGRGTVTNENGDFSLNIPGENLNDTVSVTFLGYVSRNIPLSGSSGSNLTIEMKREFISIPEIIIRLHIPQDIIAKTIASIGKNYGNSPALLTAFYREGVMKKEELQVYSEALLGIYKSPYTTTLQTDQVKVLKSRKIENTSIRDTFAVRLKAGLSTCLELDGAKNIFDFINAGSMADYTYRVSDIVTYDTESAYVIDFEQKEQVELPLYRGTVYINSSDYAILKADFELHPQYISRLKESFVSSSTRGIDTWPLTASYSVSYRKEGNRYFLNHVRGDLLFTSKQRKRLFKSEFKVFFELATTGIKTGDINRFDREEIAPVHSVFSKTITSYDPEFWGAQDFLKPEENLLQALKNMKVKLQEFSEETP